MWLVLVPQLEPSRSAPKRLAKRLAEIAPANATIVLGDGPDFKELPSLPFYISEYFDDYYHELMLETAQKRYEEEENLFFVMSDYWANRWEKEWNALGKPIDNKEKLEGWETTNLKESSYWIIYKNSSNQ